MNHTYESTIERDRKKMDDLAMIVASTAGYLINRLSFEVPESFGPYKAQALLETTIEKLQKAV